MNANQLRRVNAHKAVRTANTPRPLNVGTVFTTLFETTIGGSPGSRGTITAKNEDGTYEVHIYNSFGLSGRTGTMHGKMMEAI